MEIKRAGSQPSAKGPSGWCTGAVRISRGEKHWHGATPTTALKHIAIQEKKDGKVVD